MTQEELQGLSRPDLSKRNIASHHYRKAQAHKLEDFSLDEQLVIRQLYQQTHELFNLTDPDEPDKEAQASRITDFLKAAEFLLLEDQLIAMVDEAEGAERKRLISQLVAGPLESICAYIVFTRAGSLEPEYVRELYYRSRDQLKIMRMLIPDLDPEGRQRDEEKRLHSIDLLLEKWKSSVYQTHAGEMEVSFEPHYHGDVAERCVDFAELDRIFYHIVNHAAAHAGNKNLRVSVARAPHGKDLIWAFTKTVTPERKAQIAGFRKSGESLFSHHQSPHKRLDLAIVADAVSNAYGFNEDSEVDAETAGFYGYQLNGDQLTIWFHWPAVEE